MTWARVRRSLAALFWCGVFAALSVVFASACKPKPTNDMPDGGTLTPPWVGTSSAPAPRPGMVWVPPGALVVGTPQGKNPRVPDEEMPGEQMVMAGFYIDVFPFPNEPGALPKVGMTRSEAIGFCEAAGKRLCTELEIERACKGPENTMYEYGDAYRVNACGTGAARAPGPNGMNALCQSGFGVSDLHGSAWTWTASAWKRDPSKKDLFVIRGGNGTPGDLASRCANGRGVRAETVSNDLGVRCCAGEVNVAEVTIQVPRGAPLSLKAPDRKIAPALEKLALSEETAPKKGRFAAERVWIWHPFGNDEIWIAGGCSETIRNKKGKKRRAGCGVMMGREGADGPVSLGFVGTDRYQPTLAIAGSPRELHLYGGDEHGAFRRKIAYDWGKISLGEKARKKDGKGDQFE